MESDSALCTRMPTFVAIASGMKQLAVVLAWTVWLAVEVVSQRRYAQF